MSLFNPGDKVKILKGRSAGKTGVVQGWRGDRVEVRSDATGNIKLFDSASIGLNLPDNPPLPQPEPIEQFKRGDMVRVADPQQPGLKGGQFKINSVTGTGAWLDTTAVLGRTSFVQKTYLHLADRPLPGSVADFQAKNEPKLPDWKIGQRVCSGATGGSPSRRGVVESKADESYLIRWSTGTGSCYDARLIWDMGICGVDDPAASDSKERMRREPEPYPRIDPEGGEAAGSAGDASGVEGSAVSPEADASDLLPGDSPASAEPDSPESDLSPEIGGIGDIVLHADIVEAELCDDLESRLTELEIQIQEATEAIRQAGYRLWLAAAEIRSRELWALPRDESGQPIHANFADYGQSRWGWGRSYTHEIATAGETVAALRQSGIPDSDIPAAASAMRELAKAPPDERPKVLRQAQEKWSVVTAAAIRSVIMPSPIKSHESGTPDSDDRPPGPPIAPQGSGLVRLKVGPALAKLIEKHQGELYSAIVETDSQTFVVQPEAIGVEVVKS